MHHVSATDTRDGDSYQNRLRATRGAVQISAAWSRIDRSAVPGNRSDKTCPVLRPTMPRIAPTQRKTDSNARRAIA